MRDIDEKQIQDYLEVVNKFGNITFQTFDDSEEKRPALSKILYGWNQKNLDQLIKLNLDGAGVFLMVNEGDGSGRKKENVIKIRALFVDLDGSPLQPVIDAGLEPHMTIESSPGRFHAYWLVDNCQLDQFTPMQKALAERFSGDKSVNDLPRVMRIPGFYHQKGEVFQTRILSCNAELPLYSVGDFTKIITIKLPTAKADTASQRIREGRSPEGQRHADVRSYMVAIRKTGMGIEEIRTLAYAWARKNCPDAKSLEGLIKWIDENVDPDASTGAFSDLVRVLSEPVSWKLSIYGQMVEVHNTKLLDSYPSVRRVIMEQLGIVPPIRTAKAWNNELDALMLNLVDEDMPDDVSPLGMAWEQVIHYCTGRVQARAKDEIILAKPWTDPDTGRIYFRTADIISFLLQRQIKIEPRDLGKILRKHAGESTSLYIKGMQINVWWLPVSEIDPYRQKEDFDPVTFDEAPFF